MAGFSFSARITSTYSRFNLRVAKHGNTFVFTSLLGAEVTTHFYASNNHKVMLNDLSVPRLFDHVGTVIKADKNKKHD